MNRTQRPRSPQESLTVQTHIVLPMHVNDQNCLFGGLLMQWIDETASIAAKRHCQSKVMTAAVEELSFLEPVFLGETVELRARVTYVGRSSMEVCVESWTERCGEEKRLANRAFLTAVAVDERRTPRPAPPLLPETAEEKRAFEAGRLRREARRRLQEQIRGLDGANAPQL